MNLRVRLEVSFPDLDCKTVGFFLKISKEIGKAWRKESYAREMRESLSLALCFHPRSRFVPDFPNLLFGCSRVLEYTKIRTVLESTDFKI